MKKLIIWLALLLPFIANAQVNGTIQKTASSGVVRGNFGSSGADTIVTVRGVSVNGQLLQYNSTYKKWIPYTPSAIGSTGIISGGTMTGVGSANLIVSSGTGTVLDNTTPASPSFYNVSWVTDTIGLTDNSTNYIYVTSGGVIMATTVTPTPQDYRTRIYLGRAQKISGAITSINGDYVPVQQSPANIDDMFKAYGLAKTGLAVTPDSINLKIDVGSGDIFGFGINFSNSVLSPNNISYSAVSKQTFRMVTSGDISTTNVTDLPVGFYNPSGTTVSAIGGGANESSIFTVYKFPTTGNVRILYGNTTYASLSAAVTAIGTYVPTPPAVFRDAIIIGYIAAVKNATNLSNTAQAVFVTTNKFGLAGMALASSALTNYVQKSGDTMTGTLNGTDIVLSGDLTADTLKSSANGILYGQSGVVKGSLKMTFSNDSTITFNGQKFIQNVATSQFPTRYSTIFGYQAGNSFKLGTQGYANSLFGYGAGGALQTNVASEASSNSIFGDTAGGAITTGTANSIFGTVAAASGNHSKVVSMGWHNMINATAGDETVSIGSFTLPENTAQSPQTVIGSLAAFNNTSGKRLTAIGYASLYNNTTGSDNVGLGSNTDVVSGSRSIAIGTKSVVTGSNKMNIGNAIYANGIDTIASSNARLGVGVADPTAGIELRASNGSANTAPLKFNTGTNLTSTEAGAMEYDGTALYFTPATVRRQFAWTSDLAEYLPLATGGTVSAPVTINSSTSQPLPTLGVGSGNFRSTLSNAYGLFSGVVNTGESWIQAMRSDATATAYNLLIQPSGGGVKIGSLTGTGTRMVVADNTGLISTQAIPGGGGGSVTGVAVASANGLSGTSDGNSVVPTLTLSTTVNSPVLAGNGTAISAATTTGSGSTVVLAASPTVSDLTSTGAFINSSSTPAVFKNSGAADFNAIELRGGTLGTTVNWQISKDNTVSQSLQITPSTTNGGATYTTPAFTLSSSGNFTALGAVSGSNLSGTNTGDQTTITGNAGTATALQTARNIQGVSFNGTADINLINGTGFVKATGTTLSYDNTTYAPLNSPALTGNPTAPTQTQGDNSTKIATTAYVDALGGTILGAQKQIANIYTNTSTTGTTTETLFTSNIAQSNLSADGDRIDFNFAGSFGLNANDKFVYLSIGGNTIAVSGNASSKSFWEFEGYLLRTSSTTFRLFIRKAVDYVYSSAIADYTVTDFNPLTFSVLGQTNNASFPVTVQTGYLQSKKAP